MQEHHSILFRPINALLIRLLGEPPVDRLSPGVAHFFFPDGKEAWIPDTAIMAFLLTLVIFILFRMAASRYDLARPSKTQSFLEMVISFLRDLCEEAIGHGGRAYVGVIGALFIFIAMGNLFGVFYFLQPPTGSLSTTVALALVAFIYFNFHGVREHGLGGYLKHFMGPMLAIAPLFFVIEIIGTLARILSLSLRLFMNIFGEHTTTNVFASLVPIVVPWPMMALGVFTAFLQAYVFALLTAVYIGTAVAHEEH